MPGFSPDQSTLSGLTGGRAIVGASLLLPGRAAARLGPASWATVDYREPGSVKSPHIGAKVGVIVGAMTTSWIAALTQVFVSSRRSRSDRTLPPSACRHG
jgi:hypothetical protein